MQQPAASECIVASPQPGPSPVQAVLLDLVWLLRQGDPFGSGVAAAALAQYRSPQQRAFLAAVAAWPAVALLWSPHEYGQHGAARLLASLARAHASVPALLVEAGAVGGLLAQLEVDEAGRFDYARCSAAALAALCQCKAAREEVQRRGGVRRLKQLVLQPEPAAAHGEGEQAVGQPLLCVAMGAHCCMHRMHGGGTGVCAVVVPLLAQAPECTWPCGATGETRRIVCWH